MLRFRVSIFLVAILCIAALPFGNAPVSQLKASAQGQQAMMDVTPVDDGNPNTSEFSGAYWTGGQYVGLNAYSAESDPYYAPSTNGGWEERVDFAYVDSTINRSDGTSLLEATYELDRPYNGSQLHMTLGGVTVTFDLLSQDAYPLSDTDQARLQVWATSDEARLVEDTTTALIDQNYQQQPELLLGYLATAMAVEPSELTNNGALLKKPKQGELRVFGRFLSKFGKPEISGLLKSCPGTAIGTSGNSYSSTSNSVFSSTSTNARPQAGNCFGCCGPGCRCIPNPFGGPMYAQPCATHDQCTRQTGNPFNRPCLPSLAASIVYVWSTFKRAYVL